MDSEIDVQRVTTGLQNTMRKLAALAGGLAVMAAVIGAATFATGLWIFEGSGRTPWIIVGGIICLAPVVAAVVARFLVNNAARKAPELIANVREFVASTGGAAMVLIDHDTGRSIGTYSKSFSTIRSDLDSRRKELPALFAGIRAITSVPGLALVTILGMFAVGILGTILLIGGLID